MLGWIIALLLFICFIVYVCLNYRTGRYLRSKDTDTAFVATFEEVGMDSIEAFLHTMIKRARREILLVSPWIKSGIWERMRVTIIEFMDNGGTVRVFIKGDDDDFTSGRSDRSVVDDIVGNGGKVTFVPRLHAKLCVVDRLEVLISSANLTRSGLDFSYEAGVWCCY